MKYLVLKSRLPIFVALVFSFIICCCQNNKQKMKTKAMDSIQSKNQNNSEIVQFNFKNNEDSTNVILHGCCDTVALVLWKNRKMHGNFYAWSDVIKNPMKGDFIAIETLKDTNTSSRRKYIWWFDQGVLKKMVVLLYSNKNFISAFDTILYNKDTVKVSYHWYSNKQQASYCRYINDNRVDTAKFWHPNGNISSIEITDNKTYKATSITYFKEDGKTIIDEFYEGVDGNPVYRIKDGKKVK